MKWQDLFTTYFNAVAFLIVGITYFFRRSFDNKSKKIGINYSLFQQYRITAVNNYFSNYAKVEFMWHHLAIWKILSNKLDVKEIDNIIWPPINDLEKSVIELKIYFTTEDHKHFELVLNGFLSINEKLSNLYSKGGDETKIIEKANEFQSFKDKILKTNTETLDIISTIVRESFYHK